MGRLASFALTGLLTFVACDKSEPVKPKNEIENKLHENPSKVIYTLHEAQLPTDATLDYQSLAQIALDAKTQRIVWEQKSDASWGYAEGSAQEFIVKTQAKSPGTVYKLDIAYFSPSGQLMNEQFIHNGQDKIHQHFFSLYENNRIVREAERIPYNYVYADKTAGKYSGQENPLGFEGFISFPKAIGTLTIKAELLHAYKSKYLDGGILSPFYAPDRKLKSLSDMDISVALNFREEGTTAGDKPSDSDKEQEQPSEDEKAPEMGATTLGGSNTTEIRKIKLELLEGHLHGMSFHYVPGPTGFIRNNFSMVQSMTLEWHGSKWEITSGDLKQFLMMQGKTFKGETIGQPVYGLFTRFYNNSGEEITGNFTNEHHQIFYQPRHIRSFSTGQATSDQANGFFDYYYRDTQRWDQTLHGGHARLSGDTDPVGHKGFFVFHKGDRQFSIDLQLWSTPKGKAAQGGELSPAHTPSAHILSTGSKLLSVQIPCYTWLDPSQTENITEDFELETMPEAQQRVLEALMKLLDINATQLASDMDLRFDGERGRESEGRWF